MKRIILATIIMLATFTGMASPGRDNDSTRYLASTLRQNWFVTVNGSTNWWQGSDRIPAGNFTTLNGPSFGGGVSVGKWITHNLALRLSYDINRGKSYINGRHDNLTKIHFLYVDRTRPIPVIQDGVIHEYYETSFMYHNLHADVMLSPVDLILGYYDKRFYTPVVLFGMGGACVSEHFFVTQSLIKDEARNFELSFNGGIMHNFRMNRNFELSLTTMISGQQWKIDTWRYEYGGNSDIPGNGSVEIRPKIVDFNYTIAMGITWNPSGTDERGQRIYEVGGYGMSDSLLERIHYLENDIKDLANTLDSVQGNPVHVYDTIIQFVEGENKFVSIPFSIFFNLDSYQLKDKEDWYNLKEIATVANEHELTIHLRGSCDDATATPPYNKKLAENRCRMIKGLLLNLDVPESRIEIEPVGGVHELDPTKYDRRVIITLIKDINP